MTKFQLAHKIEPNGREVVINKNEIIEGNMKFYKIGPLGGPHITIGSEREPAPTMEELGQLIIKPDYPQVWGAAAQVLPRELVKLVTVRRQDTVVGYASYDKHVISLSFPRNNGIAALRTIEEHLGSPLPAGLAAALVAALSLTKPSRAPATFAYYGSLAPSEIQPPLNRRQVEEATSRWLNEVRKGQAGEMPRSGIDRGRMLVMAGGKLWDPLIARQCADEFISHGDQVPTHLFALSTLAEAARVLRDMTEVEIAGQQLNLEPKAENWSQYLELVRGDISGPAVRFLCGSSFPQSLDDFIWLGDVPPNPNALVIEDTPSAAAWSKSLIRDATENAYFVPSGGFRLAFPRGYPLRTWGMLGLRVHADPEGLWVSTHPNKGQNVFRWEPGGQINPILIPSEVAPLIDITLSALWRDIKVAGETVVRRRGNRKSASASKPRTREQNVRYLPRNRIVFSGEAREWGSQEEHEAIKRLRHGVGEHFRRLHDGQQASDVARQNAADFGYAVVPDGFTFVKPHVRGHGGEEIKKTVTVVAQGLQAATVFLDKQKSKGIG